MSAYAEEYPFGFQLEQFVLLVSVSAMWSNFVNMTDGPGILQCLAALTHLCNRFESLPDNLSL